MKNALSVLLLVVSPSLIAQTRSDPTLGAIAATGTPVTADTYGTQGLITYSVEALAFSPNDSAINYTVQPNPDVGIYRTAAGGSGCFVAPVHLPQGAKVYNLILDFCDSNAVADVNSLFFIQPLPSGSTTAYTLNSIGTPGCGTRVTSDISASNVVIDNYNNAYFFRACLFTTDNTNLLKAMAVQYKLQVSAAPGTATFSDVPMSHPFFQFIEALAASGITAGCNLAPPQFCPDAPVTRGQMAVFLSRALGLHWPN